MYALGTLEGDDRLEIDAHLLRGCSVCRGEIERAVRVISQLAYLAPHADPPPRLRRRLLQQIKGRGI